MSNKMKRVTALLVLAALLVTSLVTVSFASGTKTFVTTHEAYMRKSPDKNSKKITTLKSGTTLKATDWETDSRGVKWYYGTANGKTGWVSSKNLKAKGSDPTKKPTAKPTKKPGKPSYKNYVKITGSCNIRKSPSLDGKKLGTASKGQYFKCSDAKYDDRGVAWYKISYDGSSAWVSSKYSKPVSSKPTATATVKPTKTPAPIDYDSFEAAEYYVTITASTLNMRYEPSTDSSVLHTYEYGDILYAMRTNGKWVQVLDEETNRSGYMSANYLEEYTFPEADPTVDPETEEVTSADVASIEELQAAVPNATLIDAPEGSTNVAYSWHYVGDNDVTAAQIVFMYEGVQYTLRAAYAPTYEETVDLDDVDTAPTEAETADLHVEMSTDGSSAVAHYYDADTMTQYSLVGPAAADLVKNMANTLFTKEDANLGDFSFTDDTAAVAGNDTEAAAEAATETEAAA